MEDLISNSRKNIIAQDLVSQTLNETSSPSN